MKNKIILKGNLIYTHETDSFIEHDILPHEMKFCRVISHKRFISEQKKIKEGYPEEIQTKIYVREPEELKYATCLEFRGDDGDIVGYVAVTETGEIVSLLKNYQSKVKNFMGMAYANAIMVGGNRLDCFSCDNLGSNYCKKGFIPICRISFDCYTGNREMIKCYGEPDIIFYIYCGDPVYTYWQKITDDAYIPLEQYDYIPNISVIQDSLKLNSNEMDYDFAHRFRDVIWGKWNESLKSKFMFEPQKLMEYVCSDYDRLASWMKE